RAAAFGIAILDRFPKKGVKRRGSRLAECWSQPFGTLQVAGQQGGLGCQSRRSFKWGMNYAWPKSAHPCFHGFAFNRTARSASVSKLWCFPYGFRRKFYIMHETTTR